MAKRAKAKRSGDDSSPNKADESSALPSAPAINTPSDGELSSLLVDEAAPAEVSGVSPPQVSSSVGSGDDSSPSSQADESSALPTEPNPAIGLAKRHKVAAGKPRDGLPRYITPPPFDVFAKKKAK